MSTQKTIRLGEILLEEGLISHDQLLEALKIQKTDSRKLGEILIEHGFVTDRQVAQSLANIYGLPYLEVHQIEIENTVLGMVAMDFIQDHKIVPIKMVDDTVTVVTNNPLDVQSLQDLQYMTGFQVSPVVVSERDLSLTMDKYVEALQSGMMVSRSSQAKDDTEEVSISNIVESIIKQAINERVSDIHLDPMEDHLRVRFRIDGVLYNKNSIPKEYERKFLSRIKIIAGMDVADSRRPQDGRITLQEMGDYDIRVSTLPDVIGENMVLRILDKSFTNFGFSDLGMDQNEIDVITKVVTKPHGIILVTGPTGSGKTTTLYSVLNHINDISKNIITVEDPVEYRIAGITQTNINRLAGFTFVSAMRNILRHDPDVILIGEIRDQETADIAIQAALTGHLVFSTLHTNSSSGAIMRLIEMNIEPFLLRSSVIAVVAQRLLRRLCKKCKKPYQPEPEVVDRFSKQWPKFSDCTLAEPVGCDDCVQTGYSGRVAIYETLVLNDDIRQLILKDPNEANIFQAAVANGMKALRVAALQKAAAQLTSLDEVIRVTQTAEED